MLIDLIRDMMDPTQSVSFASLVIGVLSSLFVVFCTLPIHEFAHAYAAHKLGDNTAKYYGRLTVNPFAHIDWFGAVLIILFGFGFAKPVPVDQRNFDRPKRDMAIVGIAGPLANIIVAFFSFLLSSLSALLLIRFELEFLYYVHLFFYFAGYINITLAAFNLIPVPPFDGSRILFAVLPNRIYYNIQQYERYIYYAVLVLVAFGAFTIPTQIIANFLMSICTFIIDKIFYLFI